MKMASASGRFEITGPLTTPEERITLQDNIDGDRIPLDWESLDDLRALLADFQLAGREMETSWPKEAEDAKKYGLSE